MDHLDAQLLEPLAPYGPFEGGIGPIGRFRVARPEDDHLAFLEAVLDRAVAFRRAEAHALSPVMHGPPVPSLPAVGVVADRGPADVVEEPEPRAEPVADDAPEMVGAATVEDRPGAVDLFYAPDLVGHDVQRLVPADSLIPRDTPAARVPLPLRVEVDPFHRVEQPVGE